MPRINRRALLTTLLGGGLAAAAGATVLAQQRPRFRVHTATATRPLTLTEASSSAGRSRVSVQISGNTRIITSNGIPDHDVGSFPNSGNPNRIKAQNYRFEMPVAPRAGGGGSGGLRYDFGVAVNGVPFDPGAAEFWQGNPRSGWQYEALGGAVTLGLDANYAHVQPNGAYHYHGLPIGLLQRLGWSARAASPLVGYAADGFPIYAVSAEIDGTVRQLQSSYRLKSGTRRGNGPGGRHDGTFVEDYEYVAGAGDLDASNGTTVRTAEYPDGTYAYFLTTAFPVIPRVFKGRADPSFDKRRA